ncbi:MAG: ankyrin repeat domain-containing protein [Acidobacteria bacterium]|nr:ankyrin repeat domain-containing protein [Acidobacteriota bacterium]
MPVRPLPPKPNLEFLKRQAKSLLKELALHDMAAAQRVREFHPQFPTSSDIQIFAAPLHLSDAQLVIAREAGFASWARLKHHIEHNQISDSLNLPLHERIQDPIFRRGVDLIDAGDVVALYQLLQQHRDLARHRVSFEGQNYFRNPSLLEFIAENPIRRGKLPANIVEVARVLLDAGADQIAIDDTLALVVTGRIVRECGYQVALIDLLCDYGANTSSALALAFKAGREAHEAFNALLRRGAKASFSLLPVLGQLHKIRELLPSATAAERHLALALAVQYGRLEIVRAFLDAGEDPNRYNPVGCHSHSTPLHQAAAAGHLDVIRLLLDRGANPAIKDILWHGTPLDWAKHEGQKEAEALLRSFDLESKSG